MPIRLSTALKVNRRLFEAKGIYNSMLDFDSRLHIDPATLRNCTVPEFRNASETVVSYFADILKLVSLSKHQEDPLWRKAKKMLTFGEGLSTCLGYSQKGIQGSGIGPEMARNILTTIKSIIDAGIEDPRIFELVPVLENNIGADRISDMISTILCKEFITFTKRIANELNVEPLLDSKGRIIIFVPNVILNDLPVASQWDDVAISASYNEKVRNGLNSIIGHSWKKIAAESKKNELKELLIKYPSLLKELLTRYKSRPVKGYDFQIDHLGITIFDILGPEMALNFPLNMKGLTKVTSDKIFTVCNAIISQYKKLIENNGLVNHLYDSNEKLRPERFPQLLFYSVADSYCLANDLDLNREINAGSGALDFKVSRGNAKVTVEMKYSSNPKLVEGYTKQLKAYNEAESVNGYYSFYIIIRVNENMDHKINEIKAIISDNKRINKPCPSLIVIDAIIKPSASLR